MPRVLIAEDEGALLTNLVSFVRGLGHECEGALDGRQALEKARELRPSLIVTDYMMPRMNGIELIRELRHDPKLADVPVVLVSAASPRGHEEAWRFIRKPFDLDVLERTVKEGLAMRAGAPSADSMQMSLELAREEMLNWVAHEIRTPLSTAMMAAQMARRDLSAGRPEAAAPNLDLIVTQLKRMDHLVASILDATRLQEGKVTLDPERCDIGAFVRTLVEGWRMAHPDLTFELSLPEEPVTALVDRERVHQIIDNLLSNAVKYGRGGARIEVKVRRVDGHVRVDVTDHGPGIEASELPRIFQRFHRVPGAEGQGHGLGLYIAATLARLHGGSLQVTSKVGKGSTFSLVLPAPAEAPRSP